MTRKLILIWFLCVAAAWCALAAPPAHKGLPGWRKKHQCYPFSVAFTDACREAGLPVVRLTYDWKSPTGEEFRHCVVLFRDEGRLWLMDNEHLKPWGPVKGTTDLEVVKKFTATGAHNMVDNVTLDARESRRIEDILR